MLEEAVACGVVVEELAEGLWESDRAMIREGYLLCPVGVGGVGVSRRTADVHPQVEEPVAEAVIR